MQLATANTPGNDDPEEVVPRRVELIRQRHRRGRQPLLQGYSYFVNGSGPVGEEHEIVVPAQKSVTVDRDD